MLTTTFGLFGGLLLPYIQDHWGVSGAIFFDLPALFSVLLLAQFKATGPSLIIYAIYGGYGLIGGWGLGRLIDWFKVQRSS
ncbi:MAG: hypothetical protein ACYC6Z_11180 [Thermoleophilia bacterium]